MLVSTVVTWGTITDNPLYEGTWTELGTGCIGLMENGAAGKGANV